MTAGTSAQKAKDFASAEACYRAVLAVGPHPGAAALLADVLFSRAAGEPGLDMAARVSLRTSALSLARESVADLDARAADVRRTLLARHAYFLLGVAGHVESRGGSPTCGDLLPPPDERAALLAEATEALQLVVALDPDYVQAWRNLAVALEAAGRHDETEAALRGAVAASGAAPPWNLLYRHGKALKRCGRPAEAVDRFCDAAEAADAEGSDAELPLFWLRLALAEAPKHPGVLAPALLERCSELLARHGDARSAHPPSYVRKLFDRYSGRFDAHLVGVLGYRTPERIRGLALATFAESAAWAAGADLGCGTGLAGVAFKDLVRGPLDGCDLSPGMLGQAEKRAGLYRLLETAEVVGWLAGRTATGAYYDLILSCDVLVYIGQLESLFDAVAQSLQGAAEGRAGGLAPPAFVFSTEAMLGEVDPEATFELGPAGRCRHSAAYIRRLAAERGLAVYAQSRETIRQDGGAPVIGDLWVIGSAFAPDRSKLSPGG